MTSPRFTVPTVQRVVLRRLSSLEDADFATLADVVGVSKGPSFISPTGMADDIRDRLGWEDAASEFAVALFSMANSAIAHSIPLANFPGYLDLARDLELSKDEEDRLGGRLSELLSAPTLVASVKAFDVAAEYERPVHTTRILTDVRPLFSDDPGQQPLAGVIYHQLRIDCSERGEERQYFFTLDREDLLHLKETVERALAKNATLTTWLADLGFRQWNINENRGE